MVLASECSLKRHSLVQILVVDLKDKILILNKHKKTAERVPGSKFSTAKEYFECLYFDGFGSSSNTEILDLSPTFPNDAVLYPLASKCCGIRMIMFGSQRSSNTGWPEMAHFIVQDRLLFGVLFNSNFVKRIDSLYQLT